MRKEFDAGIQRLGQERKTIEKLTPDNYEHIRETLGHDMFWLVYTEEGFNAQFIKDYNEAFKLLFMKISQDKISKDEIIYVCLYLKEIMTFRTRTLLEY